MTNFTAKAETVIDSPVAKVWQAIVDPVMVKQYLFGTDMKVSAWEVGGKISYSGSWEGKPYEDKGTILEIIPEKKLVSTYWSSASGTEDKPENYMKVTYELIPEGDGTKMMITQENAPTQESADHSAANWESVLEAMKKLVENN